MLTSRIVVLFSHEKYEKKIVILEYGVHMSTKLRLNEEYIEQIY